MCRVARTLASLPALAYGGGRTAFALGNFARFMIVNFALAVSGAFAICLGALGSAVGVLAILDPVSAQMADNHNPFATPPSHIESFLFFLVFVSLVAAGVYMWWKLKLRLDRLA